MHLSVGIPSRVGGVPWHRCLQKWDHLRQTLSVLSLDCSVWASRMMQEFALPAKPKIKFCSPTDKFESLQELAGDNGERHDQLVHRLVDSLWLEGSLCWTLFPRRL